MKKIFLLLFIILCQLSVSAQNEATDYHKIMERYKKLYLEDKIGGDAYLTMLLTVTNLSVAEQEGKLKAYKTGGATVSDQEIAKAFSTLFSGSLTSEGQIRASTETVLKSAGIDKASMDQISGDLTRLSSSIQNNKTTFNQPAYLSNGFSYIALRSSGMSNSAILSYLGNAALLGQISEGTLYSPEFMATAASAVAAGIQEGAQVRAINDAKQIFFNKYGINIADYNQQRNKTIYPDVELNSTNWKGYFNEIDYKKAELRTAYGTKILHYLSSEVTDGILITWKETEVSSKEKNDLNSQMNSSQFYHFPVFNSTLKFDFSKDFEFKIKFNSAEKIKGLTFRFNVGSYYTLDALPLLGFGKGAIRNHEPTGYNPKTNIIEYSFGEAFADVYKGLPNNDIVLVIMKKGNELISYWEGDNKREKNVAKINQFLDKGGFKLYIVSSYLNKAEGILIKDISLKYL